MTIKQLRILPPFAIGRLGSASEPMDNYTFDLDIDPDRADPLGYRELKPQPTLIVNENSGEIEKQRTPHTLEFKRGDKIRPVAPFLEVFAVTDADELVPLTTALLQKEGLNDHNISWRATVSNRKIVRRTGDEDDLVHAQTKWFSDHRSHTLAGKCTNFVAPEASVNFGTVRFIKPNHDFPEIRLRFTPAEGLIYGPDQSGDDASGQDGDPDAYQIHEDRAIYNSKKSWFGLGSPENPASNQTLPPSLFAINPPAPSWLFDNVAISRGYFDDACDGFVEVQLALKDGSTLTAKARICAAPPAMAPDSLFVRTLADDLEQVIKGPDVEASEPPDVTRARAAQDAGADVWRRQ